MNLNPDMHYQYALERQQRLRDEAAAHTLADRVPARTRIARLLRRAPNRQDAARAASGRVAKALTQRS
jgi:hypothetical protein